MSKKINHLVVDTTAFIKAANLQAYAENVYTIQEVIDEITNDRQRRRLVVLPYDLKVKDVFTENIKFITEFSKKTGDYTSLSATDIKVMALAYQLEKEIVGTDHLKTTPTVQKFVKVTGIGNFNLHPDSNEKDEINENKLQKNKDTVTDETNQPDVSDETSEPDVSNNLNTPESNEKGEINENKLKKYEETVPHETSERNASNNQNTVADEVEPVILKPSEQNYDIKRVQLDLQSSLKEEKLTEDITEQIKNIELTNEEIDNVMVKLSDDDYSESEEESGSDEGDWITPSNLAEKRKEMDLGVFEDKNVEVACITSDFAMQNVLKQIGLNVTAIDGRVIRQLRTFIFRCTTCFKTTSVMTKLFCPKCGHATLKKVGVSIDDEGNQHIHINGRKPLTARGKRFSLPTPRGGQHFQYPILTEDQHIRKRFATKMARNKTNALDPDYTAGFSPFVMKDVNSKSAVLGVRADKQDVKYWMKHWSKGKKK